MSKIEEKVLTREQMLHLQELGVDISDAALSWVRFVRKSPKLRTSKWQVRTITAEQLNCRNFPDLGHYQGVPTYTLQEILDKFPPKYHDRVIALSNGVKVSFGEILEISRYIGAKDEIFYGFHYGHNLFNGVSDPNPLQAAYKMLCWVLEEKPKQQ